MFWMGYKCWSENILLCRDPGRYLIYAQVMTGIEQKAEAKGRIC